MFYVKYILIVLSSFLDELTLWWTKFSSFVTAKRQQQFCLYLWYLHNRNYRHRAFTALSPALLSSWFLFDECSCQCSKSGTRESGEIKCL